jgi:flagellar basal body-associated protein FliL
MKALLLPLVGWTGGIIGIAIMIAIFVALIAVMIIFMMKGKKQ